MPRHTFKCLLVIAALGSSVPVFADDEATLHQVFQAAQSGHLDQAQQMMTQVLRDHPNSAKAHYVEAELDAKQGQLAAAQSELSTAEHLEPGLPFAKPDSVQALRAQLSSQGLPGGASIQASHGSAFPWGFVLVLLAIAGILWMIVSRRRNAAARYAPNPNGFYSPNGGAANYGPSGISPAGGIGSGIVGGLASGLAVGAGVVAGEELAHHFLDGDRRSGSSFLPEDSASYGDSNANMGGSDFGVSDAGSWDDSSSLGGGSDDDWN